MSRTFRHVPTSARYIQPYQFHWYSLTGDLSLITWDDKHRYNNGYDGGSCSALYCDAYKEYVSGRKTRKWLKRFRSKEIRRAGKQEIKNQCDQ